MSDAESKAPILGGVICTYQRPDALEHLLDVLAQQVRLPQVVVVVDNGSDTQVAELCASHALARHLDLRYLDPGTNSGPAGAFRLGIEHLLTELGPDDLIALFDDDDPPPRHDTLADLYRLAIAQLADPMFAGIGLRGGQMRRRLGIVRPVPRGTVPPLQVTDHLHGGFQPIYRVSACREVRPFDPDLFWGCEELEFGTRLTRAGWHLYAAAEVWARCRPSAPKRRRRPLQLHDPAWRDYYRHRNLLVVLRRDGDLFALCFTIGVRLLAKPILLAFRSPSLAARNLRWNYRAVSDSYSEPLPDRRALITDGAEALR